MPRGVRRNEPTCVVELPLADQIGGGVGNLRSYADVNTGCCDKKKGKKESRVGQTHSTHLQHVTMKRQNGGRARRADATNEKPAITLMGERP